MTKSLEKIIEHDIADFGRVVRITGADFPRKLQILREKYDKKYPLSLIGAAYMLMSAQSSEELYDLYQQGFYTSETAIYTPNQPILITKAKFSPVLNPVGAKLAAEDQGSWEEYYLSVGEFKLINVYAMAQIEETADKKGIFIIDNPQDYNGIVVPCDCFAEDDLMKFLFGKNAHRFGLWLKEQRIDNFEIRLVPGEDVNDQRHGGGLLLGS